MKTNKGFTLIEIMIVIVLIGVAATIVTMLMNTSNIDTKGASAKLKSDFSSIETAYMTYNQNTGLKPTGLADAAFVPGYLSPPRTPTGLDNTYGTTGYNLAYATGQPAGQNGTDIAVKVAATGPGDDNYLTLKKLAGDLPATKFYYNTSVPAVGNMADPAGAATVYGTYWITRY